MRYNHVEKSIITTIDRIEIVKEQIVKAADNTERKRLQETLNKLYIMRSYYIALISRR